MRVKWQVLHEYYDYPENGGKTPQDLLSRCQGRGLDRPLPENDDENRAMQALCPASMIGIVACLGSGQRDWCDVKTPDGPRVAYLKWRGSEGSSPRELASGGAFIGMGTDWFDAGRGDARAARTTCCQDPPPPPPPPSPPPPPPGGGGVIIALGAGGGGVALLLVLLIVIVVCRKGKKPAVPPPAQPNMMPQAQRQIEMGTISTSVMSASPAATAVPVAQTAVPVQTADPFPPTSNNLAFAPRFDVNTGQPIPKFDPNTGQQNWA